MAIERLTIKGFEEHPVWTWTDDKERYVPVESTGPVPDDVGTVFVKAEVVSAHGDTFNGYVAVSDIVYAVGIFVDDDEFGFNRLLPEMSVDDVKRLEAKLGRLLEPFFPLQYRTDISDSEGKKIAGTFTFSSR